MTPEREAQMREMYIKEFGERPNSAGSYREQDDADEWDVRLSGFLACARALEQFAGDAYDLGWLSCVEWSNRDDLAADMQSPAYLNQRNLRLKALAEKPTAAMSAALEDRNAEH